MPKPSKAVLLRIRPALPNMEETSGNRGPLLMEPAIAAMHALNGANGVISLAIASHEGKIGFYVRALVAAAHLIESQLYAQYPDIDIEQVPTECLDARAGEQVVSVDLALQQPEVYPIKRHPQFDDLLSRQTVDPIAGITATLVRYPHPSMHAIVQIVVRPVNGGFRRRVLKFLPLLTKGLAHRWPWYGSLFASVHLARSWKWWLLLPLNLLMGGFRTWFSFIPAATRANDIQESGQSEHAFGTTGKRSHEREDAVAAIADKVNRLLFAANVRVSVITATSAVEEGTMKLHEIASSFSQFTLPHCNGFRMKNRATRRSLSWDFATTPYVLSVEELATLWHFPNALVKTPTIDWVLTKKLQPPLGLPLPNCGNGRSTRRSVVVGEGNSLSYFDGESSESHCSPAGHEGVITPLGEAVFRGQRKKFGIKPDDRRRHMYIIGKTGMGKTTLLENMIVSDIQAGRGVGVIDPHGDLIGSILGLIPRHRCKDVILFDPSDKDFPVSFNILCCQQEDQHALVVSGLMSVFTKLWPDVWSGRMEHILRNTLLALIESPGNSMLGIMRMYSDGAFRKQVVEKLRDQLVKSFWEDEYAVWSEKYRTEAIAAIQNKVGQLLSVPMIRNIIGQTTSKLKIREAMDSGMIILANLSKGNLGEDTSAFLGSLLVTKFQLDAMSRANIPEAERTDFYLYVDEFQNFATESFASILSEARKYRLNLTLANQYIGQLLLRDRNPALKDAVFGNVGSLICFQVGPDDAEIMTVQLEEMVQPKDILGLPKYHAYMRLMIDGVPSKPFSVSTLPPPTVGHDASCARLILEHSRGTYSEKCSVVEEDIAGLLASAKQSKAESASEEKAKEKTREEIDKARKKGMKLAEYRTWRDREMWLNEFNALRKQEYLGVTLSMNEKTTMKDLEQKLQTSGGVPPPSKTMLGLKTAKCPENSLPACATGRNRPNQPAKATRTDLGRSAGRARL